MEHAIHYVWMGLVLGAVSFAHCLGMCGGFALHLSQGKAGGAVLGRQLLWHAGKTGTYVFLGALAGFAGGLVGGLARLPWIQNVLAYAAGGVMILMGLVLLGLAPTRRQIRTDSAGEGMFASLFRQFFRNPTPTAAFVLGLATGFLPCPIVVGGLLLSLESGSVLAGMATMAAMGVGTVWALLLLGLTGHMLTLWLRRWGAVVGGVVLVLLGLATVLRGTEWFHHVLGCAQHGAPSCHAPAAGSQPTATQPSTSTLRLPPCCASKHAAPASQVQEVKGR
jgi:uncharacterized protein